jgi:hypothetical protein
MSMDRRADREALRGANIGQVTFTFHAAHNREVNNTLRELFGAIVFDARGRIVRVDRRR